MVLSICQTNCYFLYREGQKGENGLTETVVIDPADRGAQIYEALSQKGFHVNAILLTHGHFDHIWGANELRRLSGAKIYAYEGEKELCEDAGKNVSRDAGRPETVRADFYEKDGAQLELGGFSLKLIATPGHTGGKLLLLSGGREDPVLRGYPVRGLRGKDRFSHGQHEQPGPFH